MKKKLLYSLIASMSVISIGAYADPVQDATSSALTTKGYVDAGLKYVYDVANGTENGAVSGLRTDVNNLQNTVGAPASGGNPATGLVGDVSDLQGTIGNTAMGTTANTITGAIKELNDAIDDLEEASQTYNAGAGIVVTEGANEGDPATIGLALPNNPTAGASYVFKPNGTGGGTWEAIEVESSWDPGFLTTP